MTSIADETSVKPGDLLGGKYRVERVLGAGGMGIVVAARHVELDTRFALKLMRKSAVRDADSVERFVREARAAVQLKGEHCVHVVDVGKLDDGAPYIVMELLVGRDMAALVANEGARSSAEAVDYILQACEGIAEAHALGIVHRDVKPQNLFVTKGVDGRPLVKVLDFGLAKTLAASKEMRALTQTTAVMGSPQYMSPEQMRASREVDRRTDLWSLGVCLYELLVGKPPFDGMTVPELCSMVLKEPPSPMPSDIPRGLIKIVMRCLEKDPAKRYATVAELADALDAFATTSGAAERIHAVLEKPRDPFDSNGVARFDPNAETRTEASFDTTVKRERRRSRVWLAVAVGAVAGTLVAYAIVGRATGGGHRAMAAPASASIAVATSHAIAVPLDSTPIATPTITPAPATPSPTPSDPVSTKRTPRSPPGRHAAGPTPAPRSVPTASAPVLTPKTTEF
jgi:serine/threonine protein kinase